MPLTRSTQIPTHARGKVRALVKAHKHWPVFLRKKAILSASAKNADLIEFALYYPELAAQIVVLIDPQQPMQADKDRNYERLMRLLLIAECEFA